VTATASSARESRAVDRWTRLVDAVGAKVVGEGKAEMAAPCHGGTKPGKFAISVGDESEYPLLWCRSQCDSSDPLWLARATEALLALGAPADCLQPTTGQGSRSRPLSASTRTQAARSEASGKPASSLPSDDQVDLWQDNLLRERMILRALCSKWQVTEETVIAADVGWDRVSSRVTFPVRDPDTDEVVQVLYRDISDNRPASVPKARTHPGVTGSYLYAPWGVRRGKRVVLCAGEHDMFAAHEAGLNAVCFTNGERAVPAPERTRAAGRHAARDRLRH
jgi:hypothetical protein